MENQTEKPNLPRTLFRDVDYDKIDWPNRAQGVIERVPERGWLADWHEIKRYYGRAASRQPCRRGFRYENVALL